jgi:hypothetical protein
MIRCDTLPRSIVFAALAAIGWVPWAMFAGPFIGAWAARALYLIGVLALYVSGLTRAGVNRLRVPVIVAMAAGGVALVAGSTTALVIGLAVVLGVARSGFVYPAAPSRAVVREAILLGGGLLLARLLTAAPLMTSTGLALWGFLLVQSFFFLLPRERPNAMPQPDPFEEAHRRALALLDRAR